MQLKMTATQGKMTLYEGIHEISDAVSFGNACAELWTKLAQRHLTAATSIGAVYEALDDTLVPDLRSVQLCFDQV